MLSEEPTGDVAAGGASTQPGFTDLHLDCLDTYPDGTARLRLAAGKTLKERTVPLHHEAADAIRDLVNARTDQPDRGILDPDLGRPVRYLFLRNGSLTRPDYLFADTLRAGWLDQDALDWLNCAKFVTTPKHAPRLRERLCTEQQLAADAHD